MDAGDWDDCTGVWRSAAIRLSLHLFSPAGVNRSQPHGNPERIAFVVQVIQPIERPGRRKAENRAFSLFTG
jgi:hypothetical protein